MLSTNHAKARKVLRRANKILKSGKGLKIKYYYATIFKKGVHIFIYLKNSILIPNLN